MPGTRARCTTSFSLSETVDNLKIVVQWSPFSPHLPFSVSAVWWSELESNQPLGFFKPTLIHLSYPTRDIANCRFSIADWSDNDSHLSIGNWHTAIGNDLEAHLALAMHLLHDVTIIVHVHEEILAPLGAGFGIVTKDDAFQLHPQRRL